MFYIGLLHIATITLWIKVSQTGSDLPHFPPSRPCICEMITFDRNDLWPRYLHGRRGVSWWAVCLSTCTHISRITWPNFAGFSPRVACGKLSPSVECGHGSVLLWRRCNTSCTSGFEDDVMFLFNEPYDGVTTTQNPGCNVMHGLTPLLSGTGSVLSCAKTGTSPSCKECRGGVCDYTIALPQG